VPVGSSEFEWTPAKGRIDLKGELNLDVGGYGFKGVIENAFFETAQDAKPRYFNYAILLRTSDATTYTRRTRRTRLRLPARARNAAVLTQIVTITADGRTSTPATRRLAPQRARKRR